MKIRKKENNNKIVCFYPEHTLQKASSKSTVRTVIALANKKQGQLYTLEPSTTLFLPFLCLFLHLFSNLTLSFAIVRIHTIRRGLQKNGQRAFPWVLGSLWWLDHESEQHGWQFVSVWSILVKFSTFYWPQRHMNSNNGDRRRRSFSFGYIFGDFSR